MECTEQDIKVEWQSSQGIFNFGGRNCGRCSQGENNDLLDLRVLGQPLNYLLKDYAENQALWAHT